MLATSSLRKATFLATELNIAARLEAIAEPGGICISDDAYRQVRDKLNIVFEDAGEQQLKNIARSVRVYRVKLARGRRDTANRASVGIA